MSDLTSVECAMLILLRNEDRELSNTEMAKLYGVRLVSPHYEKLNADGYVESVTKKTPYRHSITAKGRDELAKALAAVGSTKRTFKEQVLWVALAAQQDTKEPQAPAPAAPDGNGSVSLDDRIRAAYQVLTDGPGEWVSLTKIRGLFIDVPSTDLDRALTAMIDTPDVRLEPESHRHRVDAKLRDAAVRIGGEDRHKLAIGPS